MKTIKIRSVVIVMTAVGWKEILDIIEKDVTFATPEQLWRKVSDWDRKLRTFYDHCNLAAVTFEAVPAPDAPITQTEITHLRGKRGAGRVLETILTGVPA